MHFRQHIAEVPIHKRNGRIREIITPDICYRHPKIARSLAGHCDGFDNEIRAADSFARYVAGICLERPIRAAIRDLSRNLAGGGNAHRSKATVIFIIPHESFKVADRPGGKRINRYVHEIRNARLARRRYRDFDCGRNRKLRLLVNLRCRRRYAVDCIGRDLDLRLRALLHDVLRRELKACRKSRNLNRCR